MPRLVLVEEDGHLDVAAAVAVNVAAVMNATIAEPMVTLLGFLLVLHNEMELVVPFWNDGFQQILNCCLVRDFHEYGVMVVVSVDVDFDLFWHDGLCLLVTIAGERAELSVLAAIFSGS